MPCCLQSQNKLLRVDTKKRDASYEWVEECDNLLPNLIHVVFLKDTRSRLFFFSFRFKLICWEKGNNLEYWVDKIYFLVAHNTHII